MHSSHLSNCLTTLRALSNTAIATAQVNVSIVREKVKIVQQTGSVVEVVLIPHHFGMLLLYMLMVQCMKMIIPVPTKTP